MIIIVSSIILFQRRRKVAFVLLSLPIAMIVLLLGWWIHEANYHFGKSTDLSEESVGDIELNQSLASYQALNPQIGFLEGENVYYPMYLTSLSLVIGADENDEIMFVSSSLVEYETSRGIKVQDLAVI